MARGRGKLTPQDFKDMETISNNIRNLLKKENLKQAHVADELKIPRSTFNDYVKGNTLPNAGNIQKIADYFNLLKSDIDPRFETLNNEITPVLDSKPQIQEIYDKLHEPRQEKVLNYASEQLDEQEAEEKSISDNVVAIDDYRETISLPVDGALEAGTGVIQENNLGIDVTFYVDEIPDDDEYDGIAMVVGRSMEPVLYHGDYLFIDSQAKLEISDIGAFQINGKNVVKKYRTNKFGTPYLESINDDYDDIYPTEDDDFRVLGIVIDVVRTGK